MSNIIGDVYQGSVYVGQIRATIGAIAATLIAVVMFIIGVVILYSQWTMMSDPDAIVDLDTTCQSSSTYNAATNTIENPQVDCKTLVTYKDIAGTQFTYNFPSTKSYKKGDKVTVYYDIRDPKNAQLDIPSKLTGWLCIGGSAVMLLIGWGARWLTFNFSPFASYEGIEWLL